MPDVSLPNLAPLALGWSLVLFRVAGIFLMAPLISGVAVPVRIKAAISLTLACAAYPLVSNVSAIDPNMDVFSLGTMILAETLIGFTIGTIAAVPMMMMELAGVLSGTTMGMGLSRVYDPQRDAEVDLLGQFFFFIATGVFLALGGLESIFRALLASFERIPIGATSSAIASAPSAGEVVTGIIASGFELGLRISAPVIAIVFLIIILMGVVGKTMPALNVLSVGFAIKVLLGTLMLAWGLYALREPIAEATHDALITAESWVSGLGSSRSVPQ